MRTKPPEEAVVVELLVAGAAGVVVVAGGQVEALMLIKVETVTAARRMAGTNRRGRSARGRWNPMEGTTWG
jgi:hypothetical protein